MNYRALNDIDLFARYVYTATVGKDANALNSNFGVVPVSLSYDNHKFLLGTTFHFGL